MQFLTALLENLIAVCGFEGLRLWEGKGLSEHPVPMIGTLLWFSLWTSCGMVL